MPRYYNTPKAVRFRAPEASEINHWVKGNQELIRKVSEEVDVSRLRKLLGQADRENSYYQLALIVGGSRNSLVRSGKFSLMGSHLSDTLRRLIVSRLELTEPMFMDFVKDVDFNNRVSLASRSDLPFRAQLLLANDKEVQVVLAVSKNSYLSDEALTLASLRLPEMLAKD